MKKYYLILIQVALSIFLISSFSFAAPDMNSIDGYMGSEWNGYQTQEDWVGSSGYVGPGYGGQDFDVEKIGLYIEDDTLYLGLQTGFEINYGESGILPGDIAIDVGNDGSYEFAFKFSDDGSNSAFLGENNAGTGNLFDAKLDLFSVDDDSIWDNGYSGYNQAKPFKLYGGTKLDQSTIQAKYSRKGGNSCDPYRNTLEAAINFNTLTSRLAALGKTMNGSTDIAIHWTMGCGNDYLKNTFTYTPLCSTSPVPEPATILLFGMGLLGAGTLVRKKWSGKKA